MISVKLLINQEHNGLELHFPEKPDRSVLGRAHQCQMALSPR